MDIFLIEEHTSEYGGDKEDIPYRLALRAPNAAIAFRAAAEHSRLTRVRVSPDKSTEPCEFLFGAEELVEIIPEYLWAAADGSSIWYEVRRLPLPSSARRGSVRKSPDGTSTPK